MNPQQSQARAGLEPIGGVLVLRGYSLRLSVERGHLQIEDESLGVQRRLRLSRIDREVRRIIIVGSSGSVTLDAIRWLDGVGLPLIHVHPDGRVLMVAAPSAAHRPPVRRAQALASTSAVGLDISKRLIREKVRGQVALLDLLEATREVRQEITLAHRTVDQAVDFEALRWAEARAAQAYWSLWRTRPLRLAAADRRRMPTHWQRFGTRNSPLGNSGPNRAITPGNALLNYAYAILEAEAGIACLAVGLDPMLGLLHTDRTARDALAMDLMEPVRPVVDGTILDLLAKRELSRADLFELPDGNCRLMPTLTEPLAATAARWARLVLPVAQSVADQLQAAVHQGFGRPNHAAETPRHRGRRPQQRASREFGERLDPSADPRYQGKSVRKRQRTMDAVYRANADWKVTGSPPMTRAQYLRDVVPRLVGITLPQLMAATGLSNASCSTLRRGLTVPHPRHWGRLANLAQDSSSRRI